MDRMLEAILRVVVVGSADWCGIVFGAFIWFVLN